MDDFQTDWNVFHSFLRYLSVGQVECARLLYRQQQQHERAKFDKSLLMLVCGYRPQEWIYTKAVPSAAHLQWLCARILFDNTIPHIIPTLCFTAVALLQECGFTMHELDSFASPSQRATTLARFILADEVRLCKLLVCNTDLKLVRLVWRDLQRYCDESKCKEVLSLVVDELVAVDRVVDAVALFATARNVETCPDALANAVNRSNECEVAEMMLQCECYSQAKHASLFRSRYPGGNSLHAYLLESMRVQPTSLTWFNRLVESPFGFKDRELQILKMLKALTNAQEDYFLAAAAAISNGTQFETTAQCIVNRLAFASVCNRVHTLLIQQIESTSKDLITPLLLLHTTTFNHHTSADVFDLVSPLWGEHWLTPSERVQVLSVCLACWIANPSVQIDIQACMSINEQTWMLHLLARFNFELVKRFLVMLDVTLQREYELRVRVGAIHSQYLQAFVEWTPDQLVAHCFANEEWDLALEILHSQFAVSVQRNLIREAMVSRALKTQQGDLAFGPVEQEDFEFQRHNLHEFQEWKPAQQQPPQELIGSLVESNFSSPQRFILECSSITTYDLDPRQVLVDYYEQVRKRNTEFYSLVRAVEAELPFPTQQASNSFHQLVGLDWNSALAILLLSTTNASNLDNDSEYSLQDDDDDEVHMQSAAECLGYSFDQGLFTMLRNVDVIDEEGAVKALKQCSDVSAAQMFCDKLMLHLQRNTTPASERWMLEGSLEYIATRL